MTAQTVANPKVPSMPAPPPSAPKVSVSEYLEMERHSLERHEYVDGEIVAIACASPMHNRLTTNTLVFLENAFGSRTCDAFSGNLRIRVSPTQYRYSDVAALCGEASFTDENPAALLNPGIIVEVLSSSTARNDRSDKFSEYRQMESLTDYLLVSQDRVDATHFGRHSPTRWIVTIHRSLDESVSLESVGVSVTPAAIYRKTSLAVPLPSAAAGSPS